MGFESLNRGERLTEKGEKQKFLAKGSGERAKEPIKDAVKELRKSISTAGSEIEHISSDVEREKLLEETMRKARKLEHFEKFEQQ